MTKPMRSKARATGLGVASVLAISAASVFGLSSSAQADYVSPDDLSYTTENGWYAWAGLEGEIEAGPGFTECSIVFPEGGGGVGYSFSEGEFPTGLEEVSGVLESFYASVPAGGGVLTVLIDRVAAGDGGGVADIFLEIPVGVHGITLDSVVDVYDSPDLGLPADPTVQDVLDALEATGDEYFIIALNFDGDSGSEVQWLAFGSETYWFGTDAEWFLNDPSCGTATPDPEPTPGPLPTPKKPVRIETAA